MRLAVLWLLVVACGRAPIQDEVDSGVAARDAGTDLADAGPAPLKLLVLMNASRSFGVTDPSGLRATALFSLLDAQPSNTSVFIGVFAGSTVANLTLSGFERISELTASDRTHLTEALTSFVSERDALVDLVSPLQAARSVIAADVAKQPGSRYRVLLVTDGASRTQDQTLLCTDLVSGLPSLADVRLNVVQLNQSTLGSCTAAVSTSSCSIQPAPATCSSAIFLADQTLLHQLANLGHGGFHSFGRNDTVDFSLALLAE